MSIQLTSTSQLTIIVPNNFLELPSDSVDHLLDDVNFVSIDEWFHLPYLDSSLDLPEFTPEIVGPNFGSGELHCFCPQGHQWLVKLRDFFTACQ
jgi:hypothetical protein